MHVEQAILSERGQAAAKVHGITDAEIAEAPDFRTVWARFLFWVEDLLEMAVAEETDSDIEESQQTQLLSEPPLLLLGSHNSIRFTGQLKFKVHRVSREIGFIRNRGSSGRSGNQIHQGPGLHQELILVGTM